MTASPQKTEVHIKRKLSWADPSDILYRILIPLLAWITKQVTDLGKLFMLLLGLSKPPASPSMMEGAAVSCPRYSTVLLSANLELVRAAEPVLSPAGERRLVLFYSWLTAKPRHLRKYADLLTALGMDVLVVRVYPGDLYSPPAGSQMVGQQVVDFLRTHRNYEKYFVFACSIGAYVFCETVLKLRNDKELLKALEPKFTGQAYDSCVDVKGMLVGISMCLTDSRVLQGIIKPLADWFLRLRYEAITRHFETAAQVMYNCPISTPGFYTYSNNDPMSPGNINEGIADMWRIKNMHMRRRVFEHKTNGHCRNFSMYPDEYRRLIYDFMVEVDMTDLESIERAIRAD